MLTHAHEDHCGSGKSVRDEAKDAEILVHGWETGHLFGRLAREEEPKPLAEGPASPKRFSKRCGGLYEDISLLTDSLEDGGFGELRGRNGA